jgi:hypothetical protein
MGEVDAAQEGEQIASPVDFPETGDDDAPSGSAL